jgi:hypothetical protein
MHNVYLSTATARGVAMAALVAAVMFGCSDDDTVTDPGPPSSQI